MQKRICRILLNDYASSSLEILRKVGVLTVEEQVELNILCLVYKCLYSHVPEGLKDLFQLADSGQSNLRNSSLKLKVPFSRTETRKRAISFAGPASWNNLPVSVRESPTLQTFKYRAKAYILSQRES